MTRYGSRAAFAGIDFMNEPGVDIDLLKSYYQQAYALVRSYNPSCWIFIAPRYWEQYGGAGWEGFQIATNPVNVALEVHL